MNALSPAKLLSTTSISTLVGDDAELIRMCDAHAAKIDAANALVEDDDDQPDQQAYDRSYEFISNTKATTLGGVIAKARAAKAEAIRANLNGEEQWSNSPAETWVEDIANGLLELGGAASLGSPDAELIAAGGEYLRIQREFEAYFITLDGDMEDNDPHWAILDPLPELRDKIATLRATTAEGYYSRARCVAFHYQPHHKGCVDDPYGAGEDRFKAANLRDLTRAERGTPDKYAVAPCSSPDGELLKACSAFCQAQADYDVANAERGYDDAHLDGLASRWSAALSAVLTSPPPTTPSGRMALARAARIALLIGTGDLGPGGFEGNATPEHRMILMALSSFDGSATA